MDIYKKNLSYKFGRSRLIQQKLLMMRFQSCLYEITRFFFKKTREIYRKIIFQFHDFFFRNDEDESLSKIKEEALEAEFEFGGDDKNGLVIG